MSVTFCKILVKRNSKCDDLSFRDKLPVLLEFFRSKKTFPIFLINFKINI